MVGVGRFFEGNMHGSIRNELESLLEGNANAGHVKQHLTSAANVPANWRPCGIRTICFVPGSPAKKLSQWLVFMRA